MASIRDNKRRSSQVPTTEEVPDVVVQRLPLYVRVLGRFESNHVEVVSSEQLGVRLNMTPAQIRKDLSYFGRFGKQGRGYNVQHLAASLRSILGLDVSWNVAVFGMGRLGRAVVAYPGFESEGFRVVAAFDIDERLTGEDIGGLRVQSMREIPTTVMSRNVKIGIVTVPSSEAQSVIDTLVAAGVRSVLNYAPFSPLVPDGVKVRSVDPVLALQSMTYYLKNPAANA